MNTQTRLALLSLASALVSAGCLSTAYVSANQNDSGSTEIIEREIPWDGSEGLSLDVRSVVRYIQAPGPGKIVARGPHRSVSTLTVSDGHIHDQLLRTGATLELTITAPQVKRFELNGRSRLTIENYDQDSLALTTQGGASIEAAGSARNVSVTMQGSSVVNLARLAADSLEADMGGMGSLVAAPTRAAHLGVRNYASAVLLTKPAELTTSLADSGRVIDAAGRQL